MTAEDMRKEAEDLAEKSYQSKVSALENSYKEKESQLSSSFDLEQEKIKKLQDTLKDLEAKQDAILEAQLREAKKQADTDFYRLVLSAEDVKDVEVLRNLQQRLSHKDAIDKVIWDVYYKSAYETLASHFFKSASIKICGIYKITNLENNTCYVGQSRDIRERWRTHIKTAISLTIATNKLYQSMKQYGPENFTFEILEEVPISKLNEREAYWIDYYKSKEIGLNSTRGNS